MEGEGFLALIGLAENKKPNQGFSIMQLL